MSNLPQLAQLEFPEDEIVESSDTVHNTFDWDFEKGDFKLINGKLQKKEQIEYLKIWIKKALYTMRNSLIYANTNYGSEHHTLIGTTFKPSFVKSEYERMIKEALFQNELITNVSNFNFNQDRSRMTISFDVTSSYGTTSEEVKV